MTVCSLQMMLWLHSVFLLAAVCAKAEGRNGSKHYDDEDLMGMDEKHPCPDLANLTNENKFLEKGTVFDNMCLASEQWNIQKEYIRKEEPSIPPGVKVSELIIPAMETALQTIPNETSVKKETPMLFGGPTGTGKSAVNTSFLNQCPNPNYTPNLISFSAKTPASQTQDIIMSKKGHFAPPAGKKAVVFVGTVFDNMCLASEQWNIQKENIRKEEPSIPPGVKVSELIIPAMETALQTIPNETSVKKETPMLFGGPTGTGKSAVKTSFLNQCPNPNYTPKLISFSDRNTDSQTQDIIMSKKGRFAPPAGKKAVVFVGTVFDNMCLASEQWNIQKENIRKEEPSIRPGVKVSELIIPAMETALQTIPDETSVKKETPMLFGGPTGTGKSAVKTSFLNQCPNPNYTPKLISFSDRNTDSQTQDIIMSKKGRFAPPAGKKAAVFVGTVFDNMCLASEQWNIQKENIRKEEPSIPPGVKVSELIIPAMETALQTIPNETSVKKETPMLFGGPTGTGKSAVKTSFLNQCPNPNYTPKLISFSDRNTDSQTQDIIMSKKGRFAPPAGKKAVVFVGTVFDNMCLASEQWNIQKENIRKEEPSIRPGVKVSELIIPAMETALQTIPNETSVKKETPMLFGGPTGTGKSAVKTSFLNQCPNPNYTPKLISFSDRNTDSQTQDIIMSKKGRFAPPAGKKAAVFVGTVFDNMCLASEQWNIQKENIRKEEPSIRPGVKVSELIIPAMETALQTIPNETSVKKETPMLFGGPTGTGKSAVKTSFLNQCPNPNYTPKLISFSDRNTDSQTQDIIMSKKGRFAPPAGKKAAVFVGTVFDNMCLASEQWNIQKENIRKEEPSIRPGVKVSELIIPAMETALQTIPNETSVKKETPMLFGGPTGTGISAVNTSFLNQCPNPNYTPKLINFSARNTDSQTQDIIMSKKGRFASPAAKKAVVFVGTVFDNMCFAREQWNTQEYIRKEEPSIPPGVKVSELIIPALDTALQTIPNETSVKKETPMLFRGPTGTGKSAVTTSFLNQCPNPNYTPKLISFSARNTARQTQDIIMSKKGRFGPPAGKKAVVFVGWNIPKESDLQICMRRIERFLNDYEETSFEPLTFLTGECNSNIFMCDIYEMSPGRGNGHPMNFVVNIIHGWPRRSRSQKDVVALCHFVA